MPGRAEDRLGRLGPGLGRRYVTGPRLGELPLVPAGRTRSSAGSAGLPELLLVPLGRLGPEDRLGRPPEDRLGHALAVPLVRPEDPLVPLGRHAP